jgi:hypothetical protein
MCYNRNKGDSISWSVKAEYAQGRFQLKGGTKRNTIGFGAVKKTHTVEQITKVLRKNFEEVAQLTTRLLCSESPAAFSRTATKGPFQEAARKLIRYPINSYVYSLISV